MKCPQTAPFQRVWETFRYPIYELKNEQLPNFHIKTPQIPTCKAPKLFFSIVPNSM